MFDAPQLNDTMTAIVGGASTAAVCVALVLVVSALRRHVVEFDDIRIAVPLVLGGLYAGLTYRVVTAGVIGANIGGGLLIIATPFVVLVLVVWAALWRPRRRDRRPPSNLTSHT